MHESVVQKTKRYFIVLAGLMTLSILFLTLKWGSNSKIYKITSHETHVHIQQIPATDKLAKAPVKYLENQKAKSKPQIQYFKTQATKTKTDTKLNKSTNLAGKSTTLSNNVPKRMKNEVLSTKGEQAVTLKYIQTTSMESSYRNKTKQKHNQSKQSVEEKQHIEDDNKLSEKKIMNIRDSKTKIMQNESKEFRPNQLKEAKSANVSTENNNTVNHSVKTKSQLKSVKHEDVKVFNKQGPNTNKNRNSTKPFPKYSINIRQTEEQHNDGAARKQENGQLKSKYLTTITTVKSDTAVENAKTFLIPNTNAESSRRIILPSATKNPFAEHLSVNTSKAQNKNTNIKSFDLSGRKTMDINGESLTITSQKLDVVNSSQEATHSLRDSSGTGKRIQNGEAESGKLVEDKQVKPSLLDIKGDSYKMKDTPKKQSEGSVDNQKVKETVRAQNQTITYSKIGSSNVKEKIFTAKSPTDSRISAHKDYTRRKTLIKQKLDSLKDQMFNRTFLDTDVNKYGNTLSSPSNEANDGLAQNQTNSPILNQYLQQRLRYLGFRNRYPSFNQHRTLGKSDIENRGRTVRPDTCNSCFPLNFRRTLNEENLCSEGNVDLLILISTSPRNKEARDAIRETWAGMCNNDKSKVKYLFVLGNATNQVVNEELRRESFQNHDIVQMDFKDAYANLTYKTMSGLKWMTDYCSQARFIMKTDDDMYVNIELLSLLIEQIPQDNFLGGFCWGPSPPHRDRESKWYVSFDMYRGGYFPAMCSGTGYILSSNIVHGILTASRNIPFFYLEDVYLALCVQKIGLHPTAVTGFSNVLVPYSQCDYKNSVITSHNVSPELLKYYWEDSRLCDEPRSHDAKFYLNDLY